MTLYHFCAARHRKSIQYTGIRIGGVCLSGEKGYNAKTGYIWLTTDPDPGSQSWATRHMIPYSRTAYRFTVEIPESQTHNILDRDALEKEIPGSGALFDGWPGSENWRVYRGLISKQWLIHCENTEK